MSKLDTAICKFWSKKVGLIVIFLEFLVHAQISTTTKLFMQILSYQWYKTDNEINMMIENYFITPRNCHFFGNHKNFLSELHTQAYQRNMKFWWLAQKYMQKKSDQKKKESIF